MYIFITKPLRLHNYKVETNVRPKVDLYGYVQNVFKTCTLGYKEPYFKTNSINKIKYSFTAFKKR